MKKIIICASLAVAALGMTSCNDFLNDNRFPLDQQTSSPGYWNNASNVAMQCDQMYPNFTGFATGSSTGGLFYFKTLSDDQGSAIGGSFANWKYVNVPNSASAYSDPYKVIRHASTIIEGVQSSTLSDAQKNKYIGIARLMRGIQYFWLVRGYGDVPYFDKVVDAGDAEALYAPRTDRDLVMDKVLEDLKFAAENIGAGSKITFSSDMAYAQLADIALWEGTFCKYRTAAENGKAADPARAEKYLKECVAACEVLMSKGYTLSPDYQANYNTAEAGLNNNPEIIFYRQYKMTVLTHALIQYLTQTTTIAGISRDAFDAFLFRDGKPKALTTLNNTDAAYEKDGVTGNANNKVMYIGDLLDVRDARLAATIDTVLCFGTTAQGYTWSRVGSAQLSSSTGYTIKKYDNVNINYQYRQGSNYTSAPVFWLSVVLCNYAEAKAELGTLNDADLEKSLNLLYDRAKLPKQKVADLANMNDPANNMGVSSLIWEVRRCRRCELMMDNDFRYWDLVRWHQLELLDTQKHPAIKQGANLVNSPVKLNNMMGDYIDATPGNDRIYVPRVYTFPLPAAELSLNENLVQNPLWKD